MEIIVPLTLVSGDPYPSEVGATVQLVMQELGWSNPYRLGERVTLS